jgi:hypothetical protein
MVMVRPRGTAAGATVVFAAALALANRERQIVVELSERPYLYFNFG